MTNIDTTPVTGSIGWVCRMRAREEASRKEKAEPKKRGFGQDTEKIVATLLTLRNNLHQRLRGLEQSFLAFERRNVEQGLTSG